DPVQDAEAVDEVKALLQLVERERVDPSILDGRADQTMDGAEALPALKLNAPPRRDPQPILLVIDRHYPIGSPTLGEERIEAIEATDIQHPLPSEILRQRGHAVAMVARGAGRINALSAIQRKGVKPKWHRLDSRARKDRPDL